MGRFIKLEYIYLGILTDFNINVIIKFPDNNLVVCLLPPGQTSPVLLLPIQMFTFMIEFDNWYSSELTADWGLAGTEDPLMDYRTGALFYQISALRIFWLSVMFYVKSFIQWPDQPRVQCDLYLHTHHMFILLAVIKKTLSFQAGGFLLCCWAGWDLLEFYYVL